MYYSFPPNAFSWLEFPDLHGTLSVDRNATDREIRSRRRELVQSWHPDKATRHGIDHYSANIITRVINHAGEVLGDNKDAEEIRDQQSIDIHLRLRTVSPLCWVILCR